MLPGESYVALVDSNANTPPDYNFETAISNIHQYGILTLGPGTPSFSMSIIKHLDTYFVFDPHSRNPASLFCADSQMCLRTTHLHSLYALSASLCLLSAQNEITPFELKNLDPKNFYFAEKDFEEAESSDSDDLTLATIKTFRAKKAKRPACLKRKGSLRTLRVKGDDTGMTPVKGSVIYHWLLGQRSGLCTSSRHATPYCASRGRATPHFVYISSKIHASFDRCNESRS